MPAQCHLFGEVALRTGVLNFPLCILYINSNTYLDFHHTCDRLIGEKIGTYFDDHVNNNFASGPECARAYGFTEPDGQGYSGGYDPELNAGTTAEFEHVAFRSFHSLVEGNLMYYLFI